MISEISIKLQEQWYEELIRILSNNKEEEFSILSLYHYYFTIMKKLVVKIIMENNQIPGCKK